MRSKLVGDVYNISPRQESPRVSLNQRSAPAEVLDVRLEAGLVYVICGQLSNPRISIDTPTSRQQVG